jgi:hypothetical protein
MNYFLFYLAASTQTGNISTLAASSARTALDSTQRFWTEMYNATGIFGNICAICLPLAFLFSLWKVYQLFEEYREHPDYTKIISQLMLPLIIFAMLSRSGAMAKGFTQGLRTLSADFGVSIVERSGSNALTNNINANMPASMKSNIIIKKFTRDLDKCRTKTDINVCGDAASAAMMQSFNAMNPPADPVTIAYARDLQVKVHDKLIASAGGQNAGISGDSLINGAISLFTNGLPSLGDIGEQIVITLLNAIIVAFYWATELATLLAFYLFPMALAMGVLDKKAIVDWFTSFWAISNAKICFAIVLSLVGEVGNAIEGASFVLELLGAIFAPTIAFMMAKGSALAMAEGFQGAATGAAMGAAKGAGGMVQKGREKRDTNKNAQKAEKAQKAAQAAQATQNSRILKALAIGRRGQ